MTLPQLPDLRGLPYYDEAATYWVYANRLWAWEFAGWKPESMSWKTGCYIHGGLSDNQINFSGPDVIPFFESLCVNNFEKFSIGAMKHAIMCVPSGHIATHGILQRNEEQDVRFYAAGPWPAFHALNSKFRVKADFPRWYLFQVAGPTSLQTLERATDESLKDIPFLRFRTARIAGKQVEIARIACQGILPRRCVGRSKRVRTSTMRSSRRVKLLAFRGSGGALTW
jgi:vanillate/3-O-methylgallate O-demethylase